MPCPWLDGDRPSSDYFDFLKEETWHRLNSENGVEKIVMQQLYKKYVHVPLGSIQKSFVVNLFGVPLSSNKFSMITTVYVLLFIFQFNRSQRIHGA